MLQRVCGTAWAAVASCRRIRQCPPSRRTPTLAVTAQLAISVVFGLVLPWWIGPMKFFVFSAGFVLVLAVILIYVSANVGVVKFYWTSARQEFSWLLHFVFPLGTSAILIYSLLPPSFRCRPPEQLVPCGRRHLAASGNTYSCLDEVERKRVLAVRRPPTSSRSGRCRRPTHPVDMTPIK